MICLQQSPGFFRSLSSSRRSSSACENRARCLLPQLAARTGAVPVVSPESDGAASRSDGPGFDLPTLAVHARPRRAAMLPRRRFGRAIHSYCLRPPILRFARRPCVARNSLRPSLHFPATRAPPACARLRRALFECCRQHPCAVVVAAYQSKEARRCYEQMSVKQSFINPSHPGMGDILHSVPY